MTAARTNKRRKVGLITCTSLAIANMIGTGVFTSLGFQVGDLPSGFLIILLWAVGGLLALCGALSYAELAAALPRSGGEYHFLAKIYHPAVGFMAGLVSVVVGFSTPVALTAMAFGEYFVAVFPGTSPASIAFAVVVLVTAAHLITVGSSQIFQNAFTLLKLGVILVFIVCGFLAPDQQPISFVPQEGDWKLTLGAPFAVALMYVMYAYSGWNASTYIMGEVSDSSRNVPWSLLISAVVVSVLYVLLNAVFLLSAPMAVLKGKLDVGSVAAEHIFGAGGARIMSGFICLGLVSMISAMTWAGPRVMQTIGEDFAALRFLAKSSRHGIPYVASAVQFALVTAMLLTSTFKAVLLYAQFALLICLLLTVAGVVVLRIRQPNLHRPFRCWGYPITPLLFAAIALFSLVYTAIHEPLPSLAGAGVVVAGLGSYFIGRSIRALRCAAA